MTYIDIRSCQGFGSIFIRVAQSITIPTYGQSKLDSPLGADKQRIFLLQYSCEY